MSFVRFHDADVRSGVKHKLVLKQFIPQLISDEGKSLQSLEIIFCSDEYLLNLNRQFLKHDYYTDILTFDLSQSSETVGEIYISVNRVKENSIKHNVSYQKEMERIVFHGVLHLCGFLDKTASQKKRMTQKEDEALLKFGEFHVKQ